MASATVKTTYSLDIETVKALEALAKSWNVSKSEALRRAIRSASGQALSEEPEPLRALRELQKKLGLTIEAARRWERTTTLERRAYSRRLERKSR
jgi:hypothetical protein